MPKALIPEGVRRQLEQLRIGPPIDAPQHGPDLRWAHRIVAKARSGLSVNPTTLQMAREALAGRGIR